MDLYKVHLILGPISVLCGCGGSQASDCAGHAQEVGFQRSSERQCLSKPRSEGEGEEGR